MCGCPPLPVPSRCRCPWPRRPRSQGSVRSPAVLPRRGPPRRSGALPPRPRRSGRLPVLAAPLPVLAARGWRRAWRSPRRGWRGRCGAGPGRAGRDSRARQGTAPHGPGQPREGQPRGSAGRRWRASPGSASPVPKSAQCPEPRAGRWAPREQKVCLGREGGQRAGLKPFLGCCRLSRDRGQGCSAASPHTLGVGDPKELLRAVSGSRPHPAWCHCPFPVLWPGGDPPARPGAAAAPGPGGPGALGSQGGMLLAPWPPRTALLQL